MASLETRRDGNITATRSQGAWNSQGQILARTSTHDVTTTTTTGEVDDAMGIKAKRAERACWQAGSRVSTGQAKRRPQQRPWPERAPEKNSGNQRSRRRGPSVQSIFPRANREGCTNPGRDGGHSQAEGRDCAQRSSATMASWTTAALGLGAGGRG
jgi:hypothetical protein